MESSQNLLRNIDRHIGNEERVIREKENLIINVHVMKKDRIYTEFDKEYKS